MQSRPFLICGWVHIIVRTIYCRPCARMTSSPAKILCSVDSPFVESTFEAPPPGIYVPRMRKLISQYAGQVVMIPEAFGIVVVSM
jgi:hypothetical protein